MRRDKDFYPTTPALAVALAEWLKTHRGEVLDAGLQFHDIPWFEPCAGYGAIIHAMQGLIPTWIAWDIDKRFEEPLLECATSIKIRDSIADHRDWPASPLITNPPFSLCDTFCRRAVEHVERTAQTAIVLTRGQWLDEAGKAEFRRRYQPAWELRSGWRPSFTADGGADNATYCWWVWRNDFPEVTKKVWLDKPTGVPERLKFLQKKWLGLGEQPDLFADVDKTPVKEMT